MIDKITDSAVLHNGVAIPWLGLGVLHISDGEAVEKCGAMGIGSWISPHRHRLDLRQRDRRWSGD